MTLHHPPSILAHPCWPPSVLYIYNEIQIRISRTVSTPRVTVWILLTLISWIMLIFTLSAHRQQTPHDMGVVTAVSLCCRVCMWSLCVYGCMCVLKWLPCCQTDLHVKGRSNYITYANEKCTYAHTFDTHNWQLTTKVKKTVWAILLLTNVGWHHHLSEVDMSWHTHRSRNGRFDTLLQIN